VVACALQNRVEEEGQRAESLSAATCRGFYTSDVTLSPHDKGGGAWRAVVEMSLALPQRALCMRTTKNPP
jgi:hypothetical protein